MADLFIGLLASTSRMLGEQGGSKLAMTPPILAGPLDDS
jgi:hypothetical protein